MYVEILDKAHEDEQKQGKVFSRKQFNAYLPNEMSKEDRHKLIKAWQNMKWQRSINVLRVSLRKSIHNNGTSKGFEINAKFRSGLRET